MSADDMPSLEFILSQVPCPDFGDANLTRRDPFVLPLEILRDPDGSLWVECLTCGRRLLQAQRGWEREALNQAGDRHPHCGQCEDTTASYTCDHCGVDMPPGHDPYARAVDGDA